MMDSVSHQIISELLEKHTGQTLSEGRRWRIGTALSGIFRDHGISNLDQLVCLLAQPGKDDLAREVVESLLNNETYFYRDRAMFDLLSDHVIPTLRERNVGEGRIRIWSSGCSTGQEALTLAMLFLDSEFSWNGWNIEILGTDISHKAIAGACSGYYTQFEIQRGLGVAQMLRHFEETPHGWRASSDLRRMTRFEVRNIHDPMPAGTRFDLVLCRNVMLYFGSAARRAVYERLSEVMSDDGWLMLGAGETVVGQTDLFQPIRGLSGLYSKARHLPADTCTPAMLKTG